LVWLRDLYFFPFILFLLHNIIPFCTHSTCFSFLSASPSSRKLWRSIEIGCYLEDILIYWDGCLHFMMYLLMDVHVKLACKNRWNMSFV
jgi:hypothetical protein